jgi:predicted AlkP superfamily pyrophosphatase or phosphodiesterase
MQRRITPFIFIALIAAASAATASRAHLVAGHAFVIKSPQPVQSPSSATPVQHVVVISIDGMKPESYTDPDAHGLKIPTLREIVRDGASSDGVQPVMPTVTYPSHTTMMTGVNPGTHGIVANPAWDPFGQNYNGYRWYEEDIRVPTLWQLARQRGLHTALIHWPVTVGAQADIIVPEIWRANIPEDLKLLRALSTRGILDEVSKEYPDFNAGIIPPVQTDAAFTDIACYAIKKSQPNLLLLHLAMVDHEEHLHGPFSPEGNAATETADAQVARIIAEAKKDGIWDSTVLVVLSDHGFVPISQAVRPGVLLREHGLITLNEKDRITAWKASLITDGGSAYIYVNDRNDDATRRALTEIFKPLAGAQGSGIARVVAQDEIVAMGGDPDAFLALEAVEGTVITGDYTGKFTEPSKLGGTHGYFPDRPEMRSSLIFYGPSIRPGKITNARMIDVGPTIAHWLGLDLSNAQGSALAVPSSSQK